MVANLSTQSDGEPRGNALIPARVSTSWYRNWIYVGSSPTERATLASPIDAIKSSTKKPLVIMHP